MRNRWTSRLKPIIALLLCTAIVLSFWGCKKEAPSAEKTPMVVVDANDAIKQLADVEKDYGYENALSELSEISTSTIDGDSYYRLQQNYEGIPVYAHSVVCVADDNGKIISLTGNPVDVSDDIDLTPSVTAEQVAQSVQIYLESKLGWTAEELDFGTLTQENLCIYISEQTLKSDLAYCISAGSYEFVVDAHSGNILSASPTLFENSESMIGYKESDIRRENGFPIEKMGEYYYVMSDVSRSLIVYTLHYRSSGNGSGIDRSKATLVESTDNIFGNTEAETALEYEKGATLLQNVIFIHDYFDDLDFVPLLDTVRLYYNDAFDEGKNALGGVANNAGVVSMGWDTGVECIDIIAHEYTHYVSRNIVNWNGGDETDAMNEAISDLFGELIEAAYKSRNTKKFIDPDWVHGRRNMIMPSQNGYPTKVTDSNNGGEDFSHGYSTVITHSAYLMWNGIDGNESKKINTDNLAKLWYRAMLMMPSDCNFNDCRQLVELAATSMKLTTAQIECVGEAFDAVGITGKAEESTSALYKLTLDSTLSVYGGNGDLYDNYTLHIKGNKTIYGPVLTKDDSTYEKTRVISTGEPHKLNLPQGAYTFTISDNANPKNTSTFAVVVWDDGGDSNLDVFTNFGGTPVKGTISEIKEINGVETNVPITNATVTVYSHGQEAAIETINMVETEGFFEVYLPAGNYSVVAEAEGYISSTTSFEVTSDEEVYLAICLESVLPDNALGDNSGNYDILTNYYWYLDIQCWEVYSFERDGTVNTYFTDLPLEPSEDVVLSLEELHPSPTGKNTTYTFDGKTLVLSNDKGNWSMKLDLYDKVTNPAEIKDHFVEDQIGKYNGNIYFYQTDWVQSNLPSDNATYLVRLGRKLTVDNDDGSGFSWLIEPTEEYEILGMCYSAYPKLDATVTSNVGCAAKDGYYVARKDDYIGLIDISGNWIAPARYTMIGYSYNGQYGFDDGNSESQYRIDTMDENGELIETEYNFDFYFRSVPVISWDSTNNCFTCSDGNGGLYKLNYEFSGTVGVENLRAESISPYEDNPEEQWFIRYGQESPYMAIASDGKLKSNFIYEDIRAYSDGLIAVKQNGKWGYADREGNIIIPCKYESIRENGYDSSSSNNSYIYPADCTDGYVVLCNGEEYALCSNSGDIVIPFGEFEALSEVYDGKLWVKSGGKWGVISLNNCLHRTGD